MKRVMLSAIVLGMTVCASATGTNVPVYSLGQSGDKYRFEATRIVSGHNLGIWVDKFQTQISGYYDASCVCYQVPLSALGWSGYTLQDNSVQVVHYVPTSGGGGGYDILESMIEILD